ncbi:MAG: Tex family protein [Legionellales bacterium]|nr:Tex family protein [Legionellales bacterium]
MVEKMLSTAAVIACELRVKASQVESAISLLDEGATVPFIARYRKEATGHLDDTMLRRLAERLHYLRDLDERRLLVLETIREQHQLTPELERAIHLADTKTRLEDLYLPYRPKRRTKALLAKDAGLEPLALALKTDPLQNPEDLALAYVRPEAGVESVEAALLGARHILMERFAEDADLLNELRDHLWQQGILTSVKFADKGQKNAKNKKKIDHRKFTDYFDFKERLCKIPSHRALALFRGRRENVLQLALTLPDDKAYGEEKICTYFKLNHLPPESWLKETVCQTWKDKLFPKLSLELLSRLRESADEEAIKVFSRNCRDLLLAAPAGPKVTMGLDPGIRTGVKVAVVDMTGKFLDDTTVFPFPPNNEWFQAIAELAKLVVKHEVKLVSIGNGTGSRETDRLLSDLIKMYPDLSLTKVVVSEAGASVYSASELASLEFPDLDVTLRGAVSIARRLQDPLAELVKIDPKAIGVGQYQHDVNQARLARQLTGVVEDCVNAVGVDVNLASVALLSHVSGLNESLAKNLVQYRDEHGHFHHRDQLKNVARMGDKAFQQAAGFLRIMGGENPLDASSVHPESYPLAEKILSDHQLDVRQTQVFPERLKQVDVASYVDEQYGLPTVLDILSELEKPGRDPRPEFKTAHFHEDVLDINQVKVGMILEGVVSNVTNFGAFVDIGVHQDGLVHISAMTHRFITDPHALVKPGDVVTVKVLEVDKERRRIGLTMRLDEDKKWEVQKTPSPRKDVKKPVITPPKPFVKRPEVKKPVLFNTAMADALSKLKRGSEHDAS